MGRVLAVAATLLAAGCLLPKAADLRPATLWDRVRGGTTDGLVVRTGLLDRPAGDAYLGQGVWATAGRPLPPELTTLLAHNGLRVGVFTGIIPGEFDKLIRSDAALVDARDRPLQPGRSKVVPVNGPVDRVALAVLADLAADPSPLDLTAVECGLQITARPTGSDLVELVCEPQIQYGDKQTLLKPTSDNTGFTSQERKPLKTFPALTFTVTLGPADYLLVGPTAEPAGKLGGAFFVDATPDQVRQRVLVVRAGRQPGPVEGRGANGPRP